jgi:hypothetical protein
VVTWGRVSRWRTPWGTRQRSSGVVQLCLAECCKRDDEKRASELLHNTFPLLHVVYQAEVVRFLLKPTLDTKISRSARGDHTELLLLLAQAPAQPLDHMPSYCPSIQLTADRYPEKGFPILLPFLLLEE